MNHGNDQDDQNFARAAAQALRRSEAVDRDTAARLASARQRALAAAGNPAVNRRLLVPATAFAATALATVLLVYPQHHDEPSPITADAGGIDALDLLTDDMSPAFYRDLKFYQWLEQERPHA